MSIGAPECLAPNCSRKTWDGFCWQHRDMRRSLAGNQGSIAKFNPVTPKLVSFGEGEALRVLNLIATTSGKAQPQSYADMIDVALSHFDAAINDTAIKIMPEMDKGLAEKRLPRSSGYDAIRATFLKNNSVSIASMSPEDFEEYYRTTDTTGTGLRRSAIDERFIANYGLRMAWEVAQHRGDQSASCGVAGLSWGDDYKSFMSRISDLASERVVNAGTNVMRNWDWYVQNGDGGHTPMTSEDQSIDVYDAQHLNDAGTTLARVRQGTERLKQNKKAQAREVQKAKPIAAPVKPTQRPTNIGAAIPPPPVYERFDEPQHNVGGQQNQSSAPSVGGFFGVLADGLSKAAEGIAKQRERDAKMRREAEERRRREAAAAEKRRAEQQRRVDEWALRHGYTPEEWAAEKEAKKKMRERSQENQALQGAYYRSGARRNEEVADEIVRKKWRRRLGGR